jgi:superfamily II DNA or RNA helicase
LVPLAEAPTLGQDAIIARAAAGRIRAALSEGTLLAPLTANITPLPHQLAALRRAVETQRPRLLLADEVGLGKTIEAGLIHRELKLRGLVRRTLIVVPMGLTTQWQQELHTHFGEHFQLLSPADFPALRRQPGDQNLWRRFSQIICPIDSVKPIERRRGWTAEEVRQYNAERVDDLVSAGWDLVIFDESHRLAGADEQVARYQLGRALADAVPIVLLLSATPHSGKTDSFRRLLSLLDPRVFPAQASIERERVAPYIIRTPKRLAVDVGGAPLFQPRQTKLQPVVWGARHTQQKALYDAATDYVRTGYNAVRRERRQAAGFLLVLIQRLVTSSSRAIRETLERRLAALAGGPSLDAELDELDSGLDDLDADSGLRLVLTRARALRGERQEVETLLALARRCEAAGPDARAETLLDLIYQVQRETNNPVQKVLVFTEFTATQAMLEAFLESRGFQVVTLNGAMSRDEREAAQRTFADQAQILISTDAGGEGLNLQFCNVVVNYDLPWNPMRIEQRIGRVDRIGQRQPVLAINLVLADSVEARVQEVLTAKLATILVEFGVDKAGDVLDSAESEQAVEQLYLETLLNPAAIDRQVDAFLGDVRQRAQTVRESRVVYHVPAPVEQSDAQDLARQLVNHPLPAWLERMTLAEVLSAGGRVLPRLGGYTLQWADGPVWTDVTFDRNHADATGARLLTLEEPRLRALLMQRTPWVGGMPVPVLTVSGLPAGISGVWGIWEIAAQQTDTSSGLMGLLSSVLLPLFHHDDGRVLDPTARWIWDALLRPTTAITLGEPLHGTLAEQAYHHQELLMRQRGAPLYEGLVAQLHHRIATERERGIEAYAARRVALERIGLANVRRARLAELAAEEAAWLGSLDRRAQFRPMLDALLLLRVVSS